MRSPKAKHQKIELTDEEMPHKKGTLHFIVEQFQNVRERLSKWNVQVFHINVANIVVFFFFYLETHSPCFTTRYITLFKEF